MYTLPVRRNIVRVVGLTLLGVGLLAGTAQATRPFRPLPAGLYTFDFQSPSVADGTLSPADILTFDPTTPDRPQIFLPADAIGLTPLDDLDAFSITTNGLPATEPFLLLFSVDRETIGTAPPDPDLVALGIPYNVRNQAERGHAAGDQYIATVLFTRLGPAPGMRGGGSTSVLVRNNFDEGGTGHAAEPPTSSEESVPPETPEDDIDGMSSSPSTSARGVPWFYFTLTPESPSLPDLVPTVEPSPANIYVVEPGPRGGDVRLFASARELGLEPMDDIDAVIVFDFNGNGQFDFTPPIDPDQVIFSLTRQSPFLMGESGANLFSVEFGLPPQPYAPADLFGLGAPVDNIDGLNYLPCDRDDILECAAQHGIRAPVFDDWNHDGAVNIVDYIHFADCMAGPDTPPHPTIGTPERCLFTFSIEEDGDVDLIDFQIFQLNFGFILPPPIP
jgi:hypothetical protein